MLNPICSYDFETDGTNPNICEPVEVACIFIDNYTLEIIPSSIFASGMKPPGIDNDEYFTDDKMSTIRWHAKLRKCSEQDIITKWKSYPPQETVWGLFVDHVNKYNKKGQQFTAPISAGMNIRNFDNIITNRLNDKYNIPRLFNHEVIDIRDIAYYTLIWDTSLNSRSMDSLRQYFGMEESEAHTAEADVKDAAKIIARYLNYFKSGFRKDKFRNCFKTI